MKQGKWFFQWLILFGFGSLMAQQSTPAAGAGYLGLGIRTTVNFFPENNFKGIGAGGMWRLGFSDRVGSDWFFDYIQSQGDDGLWRKDYHIGWSVQFMLKKPGSLGSVQPYVIGGQCFDLTRVGHDVNQSNLVFSAAVQTGLGLRTFVLPRMELNLQAQYMMHLGADVHAEEGLTPGTYIFETAKETDLRGHILLTGGCSYYFAQLFGRK